MKCEYCGSQLEPDVTFCNKCGTPVTPPSNDAQQVGNVPQTGNVTPAGNGNKKSGKTIIFVVVIVIALALIGVIVGSKYSSTLKSDKKVDNNNNVKENNVKDDKDKDVEKKLDDDDDEIKQIELDTSKLKFVPLDEKGEKIELVDSYYDSSMNHLVLLMKSNNNEPVQLSTALNYLDETDTKIDKNIDTTYVDPGKYVIVDLYNSTRENFSDYSVSVSASSYKSYFQSYDITPDKIKTFESSDSITFSYTNEFDKEIHIHYAMLFYKNDELVFYRWFYMGSIKPGLSESSKFYLTSFPDYTYQNPDMSNYFDRYEIVVSAAYSYDTDY